MLLSGKTDAESRPAFQAQLSGPAQIPTASQPANSLLRGEGTTTGVHSLQDRRHHPLRASFPTIYTGLLLHSPFTQPESRAEERQVLQDTQRQKCRQLRVKWQPTLDAQNSQLGCLSTQLSDSSSSATSVDTAGPSRHRSEHLSAGSQMRRARRTEQAAAEVRTCDCLGTAGLHLRQQGLVVLREGLQSLARDVIVVSLRHKEPHQGVAGLQSAAPSTPTHRCALSEV